MKVSEMVERLLKLDQDLNVYFYDPERGDFVEMWNGQVMNAQEHEHFNPPEKEQVVF